MNVVFYLSCLLLFMSFGWILQAKVEKNILHIAGKKRENKPLNPEVKVIRMERQRARYMRKHMLLIIMFRINGMR